MAGGADACFVDLAVTVVVFAVALGFHVFIVCSVVAVQLALLAGVSCALADADLFGARLWDRQVVIDLAVAVVVCAIASLGCVGDLAVAWAPLSISANLRACLARSFAGVETVLK